jgi:hypothetical protein
MKRLENNKTELVDAALDALRPDRDGHGIVPPLDDLSLRRMADHILHEWHREQRRSRPLIRYHRAMVAAGLLVALAIGFWMLESAPDQAPPPAAEAVEVSAPAPETVPLADRRTLIPGSRFALLFGEVLSGSETVEMGAAVPATERIRTLDGQAALYLPTGIAAGLAEHTAVRMLWSGNTRYGVSLKSGTALFSVDPLQSRGAFFVDTPAGTIHVTGTLFSVAVSPAGGGRASYSAYAWK